ncbi:hypothetical protein HFE03_07725 [Paenibacillus sp. EKM102P]|uniref:hypothetical protein n=1 Tax=unclassified Paenibacillus TaxID=185978 RepID=UPI00142E5996|nr:MULTISPECIES: hypothetical protein [unclassified Paenibacillus]KAF6620532.1 hypothetical protein HFE00_05630 [Paenibacillus sp. EKM101P]KAF6623524.1 hypothetical protein HFE03_07725 [Paenibacillus sp. EKM102P]KAF6633912.1 hypothetical protein HFE01_06780 [Paenibacillus sp. EKM10P]KAF6649440.1 hypothetical protein HFE02_01745 [Paenibacillus sp. EKM11P]
MTISVPIEIIRNNKTQEFIELQQVHESLDNELKRCAIKLEELYVELNKTINPTDRYGHSYTYNYEYFKKRTAWREALLMQDAINEVVNVEGEMQEVNAAYIEVREKLRVIYRKCGMTDVVI